MTIEEALALLERHHITRSIDNPAQLMLHHENEGCEMIGEIYNGPSAIYLADYIPSQLGMTYNDVQKSIVILYNPRSSTRLQAILDGLPDSAKRYDDAIRSEKVKIVKRYFSKRNMKIKIIPSDAEIPDPPDEGTLYIR